MEKVFSPKLFGLIKDGSVKKNLSKDILAGIVVGTVALPLAIAFAVASGVSPEKGIIIGYSWPDFSFRSLVVAGYRLVAPRELLSLLSTGL